MLKLIQVEFLKLRRRKFIWLMLLAALFMPLAAVFYFSSVKGTGVDPIMFYKWTAFSYTPWIILPVVLGMLCTMLMYNENQYDMLKQLWIVGLIVFAQGQFTFYDRRYIDGAGWFMTAAQSLATFYVLPAVIALLGSYMICREEQEDTLKSLRLIPVDEVKLTLAKMILAFVFSVLIYLLLFAITFLVEAVLHLEALSVGLVLENLKIYFLDGVGVFFAISPIIALVARMKKGYWLALVFAEIYSFAGLFASMSQQLKTVYPMTAVFNISGYYNANMFQVLIGVVILMVCVILSLLILKGLNRKTK